MRRRFAIAAVAAAPLIAAPAPVGAATVSVEGGAFLYVGAPAERSQVTITRHVGAFEVQDPQAPVVAGAGCVSVTAGVATCSAPVPGASATIRLGDEADWVLPKADPGLVQDFVVDGGAGDDTVQGAGGDDTVAGGTGQDSIFGNDGDDTLLPGPDAVDDGVHGGAGVDTISYEGSPYGMGVGLDGAPVVGALHEDRLGDDLEHAIGGDGADILVGGAGDNDLHGGPGDDRIRGGAGGDDARGGLDDDTVEGGDGMDSVDGDAGDDVLRGGVERDNLYGEAGADTMDGGPGDDNVHGDAGDDRLGGGDGNDYISAGGGVNVLDGGAGADALIGWGGPDDTVSYADRTTPVSATVAETTGLLPPADDGQAGERDNLIGIETVIGGSAADTLVGHEGANVLVGGAGADVLNGAGGPDALDGGADIDAFEAGAGDDAIAARDGTREQVRCGDGSDSVAGDPRDVYDRDCETVSRATKE